MVGEDGIRRGAVGEVMAGLRVRGVLRSAGGLEHVVPGRVIYGLLTS